MQIQWIYGNNIERNLDELGKKIKELDPTDVDFTIKKMTLFNSAKRYFSRIQQEESFIDKLIKNLEQENEIIKRDNITLEIEIKNINNTLEKLKKEYEKGVLLQKEIENIINNSPDDNKFYMENYLNPLEKKIFYIKQIILIK